MNQEKIGVFISDMRKSQGMSQKQLADAVGVTDKAVSKWETGKSLPEISKMESLCEVLHININELISGECLPEAAYSKKAEENMLSLIHESETKTNQTNIMGVIVMLVLSFVPIAFIILYGHMDYFDGSVSWVVWIDPPTVTTMAAITLLYLFGTKSVKSFGRAFAIVIGKATYTDTEIHVTKTVVKMVQISWLVSGILISILGYVSTAIDVSAIYDSQDRYAMITLNFALASLGIVYGLIGYLILTPVKAKLESAEPTLFTLHINT